MSEDGSGLNDGAHYRANYRVYWEDTDAGGVVYHARYLQFLERARSDWLTELGISQTRLRNEEGLVFAVTRVEIDFRKPARLEDELAVSGVGSRPSRGQGQHGFQAADPARR